MRDVSAAFLSGIRSSHRAAIRVSVVAPGQTGPNPVRLVDLKVISGEVRLDASAQIRSSVPNLVVDGHGWQARPGAHPLQPYGNELFLERGLYLQSGVPEYAQLGYHKIYSAQQDTPPDGPVEVTAYDRMMPLQEAGLIRPRQVKKTESVSGIFLSLVQEVYPGATVEFDDTTGNELIGRDQIIDQDRFQFLANLARSYGKIMFFDHRGILVVRDAPDPTSSVFDIDAGRNGVLVSSSRSLDREGVYNGVVVEGEAPDGDQPAIRRFAWDSNPDSPTYWDGPYGKVPRFFSSPMITKWHQAISAARHILERSLGLPYNIDFTAVPNPALEPYDPIRVTYSTKAGRETHVIETLDIPLSEQEPITGTTREQSTVQISDSG